MRIGVISDTHGHTDYLLPALDKLTEYAVEQVLHCGDIGSPGIVRLLAGWPAHYVLGNCDHPRDEMALRGAMEASGHKLHGRFGDLTLGDRRIALLHGDDERRLADAIHSGQYDLVCSGHTHVASCVRHGLTVVLNPGALYRASPHAMAIVDLADMAVTSLAINSVMH